MFLGHLSRHSSVHLSVVCPLTLILHDTVSVLSRGISMKLDTSIHHFERAY